MLKTVSFLLLLLLAWPGLAQPLDETLPDPAQEQRAREISRELRCLVCQNQSIEDSNAPLARDLRRIVRERVAAGDSDSAILDYLVARYGEWVLLKPRFSWQNLLLWLGPLLFLVIGGIVVALVLRRQRSAAPVAPPLSAEEQARLELLLKGEGEGGR
ncbi:MAG TPA: cytochrome c-type biogenesis protein [Ferrovibrio sp.]|jgi:cytochrome c-type biogenesis protein CcmH|uniref:cytochrome c-type biogenesis protein n=1 Tax=Ferrovibrio sp. TaxID=1917215 RepID=UPI002B4B2C00|nr:cytochrome c-type biogenesis protein [Ferrovibrio sp.]HLT78478.1 cytochrome c-type biogenesis protein [Ferrovibrio sp.]